MCENVLCKRAQRRYGKEYCELIKHIKDINVPKDLLEVLLLLRIDGCDKFEEVVKALEIRNKPVDRSLIQ